MNAADIMTREVVSVDPEMDVAEVARILLARRISGAPVVDRSGNVIGMVSESDLMRRADCSPEHRWWLCLVADRTAEFVRRHGTRVRDIMADNVVAISKDATLADIARTLERHAIDRVPVLEGGHLAGIVSRSDVLRGLGSTISGATQRQVRSDIGTREEIYRLIKNSSLSSLQAVSIIVVDGTVYLWGMTDTQGERDAIRVAAESIVGVENVHDYLNALPDVLQQV